MLICLLAYFIRDWRSLQLVFSLMSLLMISYFFLLPESPRWLLVAGKLEEAKKTLQYIANKNGVDLDVKDFDASFESLEKSSDTDYKRSFLQELVNMFKLFIDLIKTPKMRKRTLLLIPVFVAIGMGNYGIHFSSRFADLDLFAVNMIKATTNFLIVVLLMFVLKYVRL